MGQNFGKYPKEYNAKIHGPYDPARFYGKADTALGDVKLAELPAWLGRRNFSPQGFAGVMGRAYQRWARSELQPKRPCAAPLIQLFIAMAVVGYVLKYPNIKLERHSKYH